VLLRAGEVARHLYLIEAGAARLCARSADGAETSVQFFFEGDMVSSVESMVSGCPSGLDLITMEPCRLRLIHRDAVLARLRADADFQAHLLAFTQRRLIDYVRLYTSAIAETPTQRYLGLLASQGERVARIPKHVLASFLGVTPVHLSRIRRQLKASQSLPAT